MHNIWRLVNMNLTEFFSTIKRYGDGSFAIPVLKEFLTTPNNPDLTNFFDLFKQDKKLASAVDSKKYAKVIGKILEDHKSYGGDPASITSALQKNPDKMTISSMDIRNINLPMERMHKFTINVSGVLLYDVVEKIYDFAKELNYDLDMEIPAAKNQKLGYTDTITLYSSNNNLFNTLDFLEKVRTISNSFGEQPKYREDRENKPYYAEVIDGIAYDSYNTEQGKWCRELVGEAIIEAIDNMIVNHIADHFELYGDASYTNYKNNRIKMIRDMMQQGVDVYVTFNSYLEEAFAKKNIDSDNIYLSENVQEKFFGPRLKLNEQLEQEESLENTADLEAAIERMTAELLGSKEKEEGSGQEQLEEQVLTQEASVKENGSNIGTIIEDKIESDIALEEFTPLNQQLERIDASGSRVLGLRPMAEQGTMLNPLEYLTPMPSANLRRLDELELDSGVVSSVEKNGKNQDVQEGIESEVFFDDSSQEQTLEEQPLEEQPLEEQHLEDEVLAEGTPEEEKDSTDLEKVRQNFEEVLEGISTGFGENITVPGSKEDLESAVGEIGEIEEKFAEEGKDLATGDLSSSAGKEEAYDKMSAEEERVDSLVGSIFGETYLNEIAKEIENDRDAEATLEIPKDTFGEEESFEKVLNKDASNYGVDQSEEEKDKDKENTEIAVIPDAIEEDSPRALLREFQAKRAAEMAAMEATNGIDKLTKLMEHNTREDIGRTHVPDTSSSQKYLEQLLDSIQNPKSSNEYLEQLLDPDQADRRAEDEKEKITYTHVPSEEELRLTQIEQDLGKSGESVKNSEDFQPPVLAAKSAPLEKGEAEKYLDLVLAKAQESLNTQGFNGFNMDMLAIEEEPENLTPSSVFEANVARVEAVEAEKSPAEKKIDEMLAALNEKQKHRGEAGASEGEITRSHYLHKKSEQEEKMDQLLESVLNAPERTDFQGFNDDMFGELSNMAVENAANLLGLSSIESYNSYASTQREKTAEEERFDAMLRGEYREEPAVVIEKIEPTKVPERVVSQEEIEMDKKLADLGNVAPALTGEYEKIERSVYVPVKSPEEIHMEKVMEEALQAKAPILESIKETMHASSSATTEISAGESYLNNLLDDAQKPKDSELKDEFTGFEGLEGGKDYLEVASTPQELLAPVIETGDKKGSSIVNEEENYLEGLLNSLSTPDNNAQKGNALEEEVRQQITYSHEPSEEELRLAELERQAKLPKDPVVEKSDVLEKASVLPNASVPSEGEKYLSSLLDGIPLDEEKKDTEFTGFGEEMQGNNALEYAGSQGLIALSLEDKIQQVAALERNKTAEERRFDAMLRGEYEEEPAVILPEETTVEVAHEQTKSGQEEHLDSLLGSLDLYADLDQESEFTGFDEDMLDGNPSTAVRTAKEMFAGEIPVGVSKIEDHNVAQSSKERYLEDLLRSVEDVKDDKKVGGAESLFDSLEEIEMPKGKDAESSDIGNPEVLPSENEFTGFEEVFFDDTNPEERLAAALAGEQFMPLSVACLTDEERSEMLNLDSLQRELDEKYSYIFGDKTHEVLETAILDENGEVSQVYDYLEENNVLTHLSEGVKVSFDGKILTSEEFIRDYLVPEIIANGAVDFFDYLDKKGIELEYNNQKGFFQGI